MRCLRPFLRQRFVVVLPRRLGIEAQIELILPAELKARLESALSRYCAPG
jgi:hypothetical protein